MNTSGKITTEQLKRDVVQLKSRASWNPLIVYRLVMIAVLLWIILVLSLMGLFISYDIQSNKIPIWWVYVISAAIAICFGVILVICAKKHADRLSFDKGMELTLQLRACESKFLAGTEFGLRAGPNGAWIELGRKESLSKVL
jgi:hypothetical protein